MRVLALMFGAVLALVSALGPPSGVAAQGNTDVDLELVLAVDISMSMDPDEQKLQRDGYVAAFRDPEIIAAIRRGYRHRIAVTYVEWAGPQSVFTVVPWRLIDSQASAEAFAAELASHPYQRRSRTSISAALKYAKALFGTGGFRGSRQVIDVSGDGVNNAGPLLSVVRPQVLEAGIVINGLPILVRPSTTWTAWDAPDLDLYYANCVIGGPGSFSIPILKNEDFISATRQKILLEIANVTPDPQIMKATLPAAPAAGFDCSLVERRLQGGYGGD